MKRRKNIGSTLESLFDETGEREEFEVLTRKKIIAELVRAAMKRQAVSQAGLARAMNTSRDVVRRLLDAKDPSLTLRTLVKASHALKLDLKIALGRHAA